MIRDIDWMAVLAGKTPDEAAHHIIGHLIGYAGIGTRSNRGDDDVQLRHALEAWAALHGRDASADPARPRQTRTLQSIAADFKAASGGGGGSAMTSEPRVRLEARDAHLSRPAVVSIHNVDDARSATGGGNAGDAMVAVARDFVGRGQKAQAAVNAAIGDAERRATEAEAALGISIRWETAPHTSAKKAAMADVPREAGASGTDRLYVKSDGGRPKTFRGFVNGVRVVAGAASLEDAKTGVERAYRADRLKGEVPGRARAVQA